jgi:hypothetical protein
LIRAQLILYISFKNTTFSDIPNHLTFNMSAARLLARAARASTRVTPIASYTRPAAASFARSFSATTKLREPPVDELIRATQVPHSSYAAGKVERQTLVVGEGEQEASLEQTPDKVVPLTRALYNQMPPQLQKMTLMDKVVVITGYDLPPFLNFRISRSSLTNFH